MTSSSTKLPGARWWKEPEEQMGPAMVTAAKAIYDSPNERARRAWALLFAQVHSGRKLASIYDYGSAFRQTAYLVDPWGGGMRIPLNIVQAVIESIAAKIAKNKPRPLIVTEGGNWSLQRQAKGLTKYLDGLHDATGLYKTGRQVFKDTGAFGTGIFEPYEDREKARIGIARDLCIEVFVDEMEAAAGCPKTWYKKRWIYRQTLLDTFCGDKAPGTAEQKRARAKVIEDAKGESILGYDGRASEMIPTYEAWHTGNGARVIAIEETTLLSEDWTFDWAPPTLFRWREPHSGIWGLGAAENLLGLQREVIYLLQRVQQAMHLHAKLWTFVKPGAKLVKSKLTNEVGTVIEAEEAPSFATPAVMPGEVFRHIWDLYAKAFEAEGVSQLGATGVKPPGLNSGEALRTHHDIESERFVLLGQDWEDVHVELADKEIALSRRMYKAGKSIRVKAPGTKFIETIDWEKVDMDENQYSIRAFPVSILPTTPAGKLQKIQELYESGLIPDRETALSLLDFPDLEGALSLQLAAIDDVKRVLEKIVDRGKYEPPEPYMNLELALRMAQSAYLRGRSEGLPDKRRDLLLRFIDDVKDEIAFAQGQQAPQPTASAPAPAPGAQIVPPPTASPVPGAPPPSPALPPGVASVALPTELPA